MKKYVLVAMAGLWWASVHGYSVDGTSAIKYLNNHQVFHSTDYAIGFVRFNNGFTVAQDSSVLMDTFLTVSGGMDLRDTGMLILNSNLSLGSNVTLTSGGNIKGKASVSGSGNTIFLGGDLTLSSSNVGRVLHITGDWSNSGTSGNTIIDGQGHALIIGDRAQIFVDTNVTLTLKNMTIKTSPKSVMSVPPIQLAAHGSQLALDNVIMDLGGDFNFLNGQLFIHDNVVVTGTSAFVYQSPRPSYITSGATWMFDQGTTFSMAPAAYSDALYTLDNRSTSTTNNFLVMADQTSVLALNGCTLKTTYTGLRLRSGTVFMDNRVQIDTRAGVDINSTTPLTAEGAAVATGSNSYSTAWSPDGRFLAVVNSNDNTLQVFKFTGSGSPVLLGTVSTGAGPKGVSWSPDGRFLAIISGTLEVYRVMGTGMPVFLGSVGAGVPYGVTWSPDGRFLAVADWNNGLRLYRFTGSGAPIYLGSESAETNPEAVAWSSNGRFLAAVNWGSNSLNIFRFSGSGVSVKLGSVATGSRPYSVAWSPDGRFLAVVNNSSTTLQVYRFNGSGQPVSLGSVASGGSSLYVMWSPDGRFLAVVNRNFSGTAVIYRFTGSSAPVSVNTVGTGGAFPTATPWSPDGRFIAVTNSNNGPGATLQVFRVNYVGVTTPQAMTSSLIFGDSANGSTFDANVRVLSGASVKIKGQVYDDAST